MKLPLRYLAQRSKRLAPLLAAPAIVLLSQGQAKAVLNFYIFESGGNVILRGIGSLSLPGVVGIIDGSDGFDCGLFDPGSGGSFCAGRTSLIKIYNLDGPSLLPPSSPPSTDDELRATASFGTTAALTTDLGGDATPATSKAFGLDPLSDGSFILSEAIFNNKTLASDFGITTTGLFGTWTLQPKDGSDPYTANDTINLFVSAPPAPGPLPLLGAGAAFAWSRQLRKRIGSAAITPPQA
jgi:MYXO-CTERM domain-containing protein